ncbi:hypothetical protein [Kibdelosporangium philippinense]|uniref:hypothetical protein n=1 Tax=Kibdelosporangium philippinense TaxID=211113 RepID=UPI0036073269
MNTRLTGFQPNTTYRLTLRSRANTGGVVTESARTNASGTLQYNELNYDCQVRPCG